MKTNLIAFSGLAGVGKSTAANYLVANHGFTRLSFADPLRDMLKALGLSDADFTQEGKTRPHQLLQGKTPREALQSLGTEWGRNMIGDEIWRDAAIRRAHEIISRGGKVVFDDCRFNNEAEAILSIGGFVVGLCREGIKRAGGHASEAGISPDLISFYIDGDDRASSERAISDLAAIEIIRTCPS